MHSVGLLGVIMILESFGHHIDSWMPPLITLLIVGLFFFLSARELKAKHVKLQSSIVIPDLTIPTASAGGFLVDSRSESILYSTRQRAWRNTGGKHKPAVSVIEKEVRPCPSPLSWIFHRYYPTSGEDRFRPQWWLQRISSLSITRTGIHWFDKSWPVRPCSTRIC